MARISINMFKKSISVLSFLLFPFLANAQEGNSVFHFLELPFSAHAAALGGENISIIEDDITMAIHNPALLSYAADKTLNFNYMSYIDGVNVGSAAFSRLAGARSSWAIAAQYIGYGDMKETTEEDIELGTFSAKDMAISGIYTYDLSDYWSGGVKTNLIYSEYEKYNSFAIGVDLGLNYYNDERSFSFSLVARNLGGQIVAFEDKHEKLPINVQAGISKTLSHAPFRFSATFHRLNKWGGGVNGKLMNHLAFGIDYMPTNNFYISLGYNFKRADEMKIADSSHWAGFSGGAGIQIKRFKLGAAYAKYHTTSSSLLFNLAIVL